MPTLTGDGLTVMTREELIRECRNKQAVINHLNAMEDNAVALLREAHTFLNAQAFTQEEMDDFCKRLDAYLGIPSDSHSPQHSPSSK